MSYKYSIIVPHYDGSISDEQFIRGIQCLLDQTEQSFEVLIYHDGPTLREIPDIWKKFENRAKLTITKVRHNDWGHTNRDRGIREASGEYIIHFNPDNIVYPNLIEELTKVIEDKTYPIVQDSKNGQILGYNDIVIFPIYMVGHYRYGLRNLNGMRLKPQDFPERKEHKIVFSGDPCIFANIDCLQLVMKKSLWLEYGGWYDKRSFGDGIMYERFVQEKSARYCSQILGEHW